jgi:valyl-tRNA synthetase
VDAKTLAKPAVAAVEKGDTRFVPEQWRKTYFEWMRNIEPWCVSRQLWWGHRIPAWFGPPANDDGTIAPQSGPLRVFVARNEKEAAAQALAFYGARYAEAGLEVGYLTSDPPEKKMRRYDDVTLMQDEDVLDTWFSSALWPFSTMGWPDGVDPALKEFYPGSVLVTAFDIIFFWVARMMMQGLHFMGEVPFKDVYIHALVLDEKGQKMSKSKGNVIDPIGLIDEFGADALRFTMSAMAAQGRNIRLSKDRVAGYRAFSTKLWNAARFAQMNDCKLDPTFDPTKVKHTLNRWIAAETAKAAREVRQGIEDYKFNEAAGAIYRFTWNVFCDWYLELTKPVLAGADEASKAETRACTAWVIDQIVHLLHPFMPFVTEELFQAMDSSRGLLISRPWPDFGDRLASPEAEAEVDWVIRLVSSIRSARKELNVPDGAKPPLVLVGASKQTEARLATYKALIERMARLSQVTLAAAAPKGAIRIVQDEATACLEVAQFIDLKAETARLEKEIARLNADVAGIDKKLSNQQFVAKAPPEIIEEQHERKATAAAALVKLGDALKQLKEA